MPVDLKRLDCGRLFHLTFANRSVILPTAMDRNFTIRIICGAGFLVVAFSLDAAEGANSDAVSAVVEARNGFPGMRTDGEICRGPGVTMLPGGVARADEDMAIADHRASGIIRRMRARNFCSEGHPHYTTNSKIHVTR
jgi:hypothetical protein